MDVPGDREGSQRAVEGPGREDRELRGEVELPLDEERSPGRPPEPLESTGDLRRACDPELAPAVVAAGRRLQAEGRPEGDGSLPEAGHVGHLAPGGGRQPEAGHEAALGEPVLRHAEGAAARADGDARGLDGVDERSVDVLQLVGHDGAAAGQLRRAHDGVVRGGHHPVGDRCGRAVRVRVKDGNPVAHRLRRAAEHQAQLPASEDADGGAGRDRIDALAAGHGRPSVGVVMPVGTPPGPGAPICHPPVDLSVYD